MPSPDTLQKMTAEAEGGTAALAANPQIKRINKRCEKYKMMVWHKKADFPENKRNKHRRWVGWESALK